MKAFMQSLSISTPNPDVLSATSFLEEILSFGRVNYQQNQLFIPILNTLETVLSEDVAIPLSQTGPGLDL